MLNHHGKSPLIEFVQGMERRARERHTPSESIEARVFMPREKKGYCSAPNCLVRSALFGLVKRGGRRQLDRRIIASLKGIEVECTGYQLDQSDFDVWMILMGMSQGVRLGAAVHVTTYEVLRRLKKTDSGGNRNVLHEQIHRLTATTIKVTQRDGTTYTGHLIDSAYRHSDTRRYEFHLNAGLHALFSENQFTWLQWQVRHALGGKQLALWLHAFYSSHAKPYRYTAEKLHELCGSTASVARFKDTLKGALLEVQVACDAFGESFNYAWEDGLLCIRRSGTAQIRNRKIDQGGASAKTGVSI